MPSSRIFLYPDSQAGVFSVCSRIAGRAFFLEDEAGRDAFVEMMRNYESFCGVEVLTFCVMSNHFHLLVRVPHRPADFDVPLEVVMERLERAVGQAAAVELRKQLEFWRATGNEEAIEEWRQRQLARMFSLSEFVRCLKFRFTRWYNRKYDRKGTLWESRFSSVIVEEEERALRIMAAYIDLNPVRAGIVKDPADYRWSGYAEAMAGKKLARRGLVRIAGKAAWAGRKFTAGGGPEPTSEGGSSDGEMAARGGVGSSGETEAEDEPQGSQRCLQSPGSSNGLTDWAAVQPWRDGEFPEWVERRALVFYRALLGGQGAERRRADGTVRRRGLSEQVKERLMNPDERRLAAEVLMRRVGHFTRGVMIGSRSLIDDWFEANRDQVQGCSRLQRKRGSKPLGVPALRGLYAFRDVR